MKLTKPSTSQIIFYTFFAATIISIAAYNIISWNFNKDLNLAVETIELIVSLIVIIQLLSMLRRFQQFSPLFLIFVQALACFALGELFWILHLYIKHFEPLGSFSISDLSWVGFYALILTAYRDIFNKQPAKKVQKSLITILCTVAVSTTITAGFALLFITGDDLLYTIIYLAPCIVLGNYAVKQLLVNDDYKLLHINILVIIYTDLFASIAINFDFDFVYIIKLVFALIILCIAPCVLFGIQNAEKIKEITTQEPELVGV